MVAACSLGVAPQEPPPPEPPTVRPLPTASHRAGRPDRASPTPAPASLLLRADADCTVIIDGKQRVKVRGGEPTTVDLAKAGQHLVTALGEDEKVRWEGTVEVRSEQVLVLITLTGTSPADFDRAVARVWLAVSGLKVAGAYASGVFERDWGFHDPSLSTVIFMAHELLKQDIEEFKAVTPAPGDQARRRMVEDVARVAAKAEKYVDLLTRAVSAAQQANSRMGEPNNLHAQAKALEPTMAFAEATLKELRASQAFGDALPPDWRPRMGFPADPRDFDLAAEYCQSTPNMLAVVGRGGLAERWGFKAGDRLLALSGTPISSIWELKLALRERAGKPVEVTFERGGKRHSASLKVPSRL